MLGHRARPSSRWSPAFLITAAFALVFPFIVEAQTLTGAMVTTRFFDGAGSPAAVAIQPDGRVLVAGIVSGSGPTDVNFALMRFLHDGRPDTTFGISGRVTTDFAGFHDIAEAVALQVDGGIVVAGHTRQSIGGPPVAALARYTAAGALDTTFGVGGKVIAPHSLPVPPPPIARFPPMVGAVAIAPSGEILLDIVLINWINGIPEAFDFQRFSGDGVQLPSWDPLERAVRLQQPFAFAAAGRTLAIGTNVPYQWPGITGQVVRYLPDGALDTTFNGTGIVKNDGLQYAAGIVMQPDGKILLANRRGVARLTAAGEPDATYGQAGVVTTGQGPAQYGQFGVIDIAPDGTIAAAGSGRDSEQQLGNDDFAVLATDAVGTILLSTHIDFGGHDVAKAVAIHGRDVIVAGVTTRDNVEKVVWTRLALNPWRPLASGAVGSDWDGDGKADMIVTASTGAWQIALSSTAFAVRETYRWGAPTDIPVVVDFDGNHRMDLAVYHPSTAPGSTWWVISPGLQQTAYRAGAATDRPVPGDYDGNGRTEAAVFRASTGEWLTVDTVTGYVGRHQWGQPGDIPVPADYDGDGRTDLAIYRPQTGVWAIYNLATRATSSYQWGLPGDVPVPGDYLGSGRMQIAIYRPSDGNWWIFDPPTGYYFETTPWGAPGDVPVPGDYLDYAGERRTDIAVWRPSTGVWYVFDLRSHRFIAVGLGAPEPPR
jgi:uncharacterized delta-60 repeat protein